MNALKLIMTLAAEECGEYFQITANLLELILRSWLSVIASGFWKVVPCFSSNLGVIMIGIVGFYGLTTTVDLLLLLLTEYLGRADFLGIENLN